jgi:hypothetical protein
MSRVNRQLIYGSLVVGFIGYNLWPFLWTDVFYQFTNAQKLFVAAIVVNLSKSDKWLHRGAWINLLLGAMDTLKETKGLFGILKFNPTKVEIYEYVAAAIIVITCLIGYRGLWKLIFIAQLHLNPKYQTACRKKTNSINIVYPLKAGSRYLNGAWAA